MSVSFVLLLTLSSTARSQSVGKIDGQGGVTVDGAATYNVPLWVAPGRVGLQPDLSLAYNSQVGGSGWLGPGWSISSLSQITRCRRTFAKDGESREVQFTDGPNGDRYCVDGQRLVVAGGKLGSLSPYGADGTEYRTELDKQAKIISNAPDELGPTSFTVYLKGGQILTYGLTNNSRLEGKRIHVIANAATRTWTEDTTTSVRYVWALEEVRDRAGNYLRIRYERDVDHFGYDLRPVAIIYTGFTPTTDSPVVGLSPHRSVQFIYEKRPDAVEAFVSGFRLLKTKLLTRVEVRSPAIADTPVLVRTYKINYRVNNFTRRSILRDVIECDGANICKPATTFEYTDGDLSFKDHTIAGDAGQFSTNPNALAWQVAEVDGDGHDDLLTGDNVPGENVFHGQAGKFNAALNGPPAGSLFPKLPPISPTTGFEGPPPIPRYVDLNGDGIPDRIALEPPPPAQGPAGTYNTPGYYRHTIYLSGAVGYSLLEEEPLAQLIRPGYALDLNGDGLPDLVQPIYGLNGLGQYFWRYRLNTNGTFGPWINTALALPGADPLDPNGMSPYFGIAIDPTGSGRMGLLNTSGVLIQLGKNGLEGVGTTLPGFGLEQVTSEYCDPQFLDVNGDGLLDWVGRGPGDTVGIAINTGNGFRAPVVWHLGAFASAWPDFRVSPPGKCDIVRSGGSGVRVMDFDGDGRQDLLLMAGSPNLVVLLSTGTGFTPLNLNIPAGAQSGPGLWKHSQVLDVNGDGLTDVAQLDQNSSLHVFVRNGQQPDLLTKITDGLGAFETFDYVPLGYGEHFYEWATSECQYPLSCVKRGFWVVSNHAVDNGQPTPRTWSYRYGEGRIDLELGEWLGFGWRSTTDNTTGMQTSVTSDNYTRVGTSYPYARLPQVVTVRSRTELDRAAAVYRVRTTNTSFKVVQPTPKSWFVYASAAEERETEGKADGPLTLIRRSVRCEDQDDFGNVVRAETQNYPILDGVASGVPTRVEVKSAFDNFIPSWLIGLQRRVTTTSTTPDSQAATRTTENDYFPRTGLLWKTRIEPQDRYKADANASDFFQETIFDRDAYGSIVAMDRRGSDQHRVGTFGFDPSEHLVMIRRQDAAGHLWVNEQYNRALNRGTLIRDPNNVELAVDFDGFGRVRGIAPQGRPSTTITYDNDSSARMRIALETQGSGRTELIHDRLGREIQRTWDGANGQRAIVETGYDATGNIANVSLPRWVGDPARYEAFSYDDMSRLTSIKHADNSSVQFKYEGLKTERQDENGHQGYKIEDELGRTAKGVAVGDNGKELVTTLTYGPFSVLRSVMDPMRNVTEVEYDHLGRSTRIKDPNTGTQTAAYNAFGEIKAETDGMGRATGIVHDLLGRPTTITNSDGATTFTWDIAANGIGQLASSTSPDGVTTSYVFDQFARLGEISWKLDGEDFPFDYTYDANGRLATLAYPGSNNGSRFVLTWSYTPSGFVKDITDAAGKTVWAVDLRDAANRIISERFGDRESTQKGFDDNRGWLRTIQTSLPGSLPGARSVPIQNLEFQWELNGDLFRRYEYIGQWTEEFHYDQLDRLKEWDAYPIAAYTPVAITFAYDDLGNLTTRTVPSQPNGQDTFICHYGENGAGPSAPTSLTPGTVTWGYDPAGDQITAPARSINYTSYNLPHVIQSTNYSAAFRYDAMGSRVYKSVGNDHSIISLGGLYERRTLNGSTSQVFLVPGEARIVAQYRATDATAGTEVLYLHDDHLGSIESITNALGQRIEQRAYDPFGNRQDPSNRGRPLTVQGPDSAVSLGFTSHTHDTDLGLINMIGRMYDPSSGHFLSADPVIADPSDGRAWNRYAYALDNPLTLTDPSGFDVGGPDLQYNSEGGTTWGVDLSVTSPPFYNDPGAQTYQPKGEPGVGLDLRSNQQGQNTSQGGSSANRSALEQQTADDKGTRPGPMPTDVTRQSQADTAQAPVDQKATAKALDVPRARSILFPPLDMTKPQDPMKGPVTPDTADKAVTEVSAKQFAERRFLLTDKERAVVDEVYRNNRRLLSLGPTRNLIGPDLREQLASKMTNTVLGNILKSTEFSTPFERFDAATAPPKAITTLPFSWTFGF